MGKFTLLVMLTVITWENRVMGGTVPSEKAAGVEHVQKRMDFSNAINTFLATCTIRKTE